MKYQEAIDALAHTATFGMDPSLERFERLTEYMGRPQDRFTPLQIAGTNGKSSTVRMIAAMLIAEGFKVGLYTSPHLVEYPERFEIDGSVVSDELFTGYVEKTIALCEEFAATEAGESIATVDHDGESVAKLDTRSFAGGFTEYEILTAAAFSMFSDAGVDFGVLEVGLGGRWDATTAVHPSVAVITGIGLDHTAILGDTLEAIAAEKAAIIEPASTPVIGVGCAEVQDVILGQATRCGTYPRAVTDGIVGFPSIPAGNTTSYEVLSTSPHLVLDVHGCHGEYPGIVLDKPFYQAANVACAICATEAALGRGLQLDKIAPALRSCPLPGRFETLSADPLLIIDAAHNPQSIEVLARAIHDRFEIGAGGERPRLLLAVLADKDYRGIVETIAPVVGDIVVTQTPSPRAIPAAELADVVRDIAGREPLVYDTVPDALEAVLSLSGPTVASGSITLAGAVKGWFSHRGGR